MASSAAEAPMPAGLTALRCRSCSAPLQVVGSEEIIRCPFCGASQKVVDARAFLDQILLQVNAWVRQALPMGLEAGMTGVVDPVARHSVFVNYVRPRLTSEYGMYRFNCFALLSQGLAVLPYMVEQGLPAANNPKDVFLFQAKVQSVSPLAVDEDSRATIAEVGALPVFYAYLLNNAALMADAKPERYHLMAQNFDAAAASLAALPKLAPLADRMKGLAEFSRGLDSLTALHVSEALASLPKAQTLLETARAGLAKSFGLGVMLQAVDRELALLRASLSLAQAANLDPSGGPAPTLATARSLLGLLGTYQVSYPQWAATFKDAGHTEQILANVADIRRAQRGVAPIRMAPGTGTVLFPFWSVDLPYSFQTGALWKEQGVEVTEALLVAASFPADPRAFGGADPAAVLTDVFRARERRGFFNDAVKRLTGSERSISGGGPIRDLLSRTGTAYAGAARVVPPLSTGRDAAALVQSYLAQVRQMDRTIEKQLRLSAPRVLGLVFVPASPSGSSPNVLSQFGGLAPRSVGDLGVLSAVAL